MIWDPSDRLCESFHEFGRRIGAVPEGAVSPSAVYKQGEAFRLPGRGRSGQGE
jgi:hypothetical protein